MMGAKLLGHGSKQVGDWSCGDGAAGRVRGGGGHVAEMGGERGEEGGDVFILLRNGIYGSRQ